MQRLGILRPSKSPYSSPLHVVPKKEIGNWRPCGDNRFPTHMNCLRLLSSASDFTG